MADEKVLDLPVLSDITDATFYAVKNGADYQVAASSIQTTYSAQAANTVFAGPPSAPGAVPTFRPLVVADIPNLSALYLTSTGGSLTGATINSSNIIAGTISGSDITVDDTKLTIRDQSDTTKRARFEAGSITTGTVRTYTLPDISTTVVGTNATQTLSNKVVQTLAGTASLAPLRIAHGVAPSAPVNGDVWTTTAGVFARINGTTVGPFAAASTSSVDSFNGRTGAVLLTGADVTGALGFSPPDINNVVDRSSAQTVVGLKTLQHSTGTALELERTGSSVNSSIKYTSTGGSLYAGLLNSLTWAINDEVNLATSPWLTVTASAMNTAGTITAGSDIVSGGTVTSSQNFSSSATNAVLSGNAGAVYLRPNGASSGVGQLVVDLTGVIWQGNTVYHAGNLSPMTTTWTLTAGNGLTGGGTGAANRTITLGTPSSVTLSSTNAVTTSSHTHSFDPGGTTAQYIRGNGTLATMPTSFPVNLGITGTTGALTITSSAGTSAVIPVATASASGLVSTGNQTWGGTKTAVNFVATSDERLKKDIRVITPRDRLADLIEFVSFLWKTDDRADLGVIAQDIRKVAPEYVYEDEDGMLAVDKASLALECVLGLAQRVKELEDK